MASPNPNRYAVLAGCTYNRQILGSVNNVEWMKNTLENRFKFKKGNITVLLELIGAQQPTLENITNAIANWIHMAAPGDVICFYFSGRCNQANHFIVTSDLQEIPEQYFTYEVLRKLPRGASFTMVVDASYCGDLIEEPQQTTPPNQQVAAAGGIGKLLSGCYKDEEANEYVADGKVYGAFTYALKQVLDEHQGRITNIELIREAIIKVAKLGFCKQHPCLYCADTPFLFE